MNLPDTQKAILERCCSAPFGTYAVYLDHTTGIVTVYNRDLENTVDAADVLSLLCGKWLAVARRWANTTVLTPTQAAINAYSPSVAL